MSRYGGSSDYTVTHVLNHMDDIIEVIEDINTNGANSPQVSIPNTQEATNRAMQENIGALQAMLEWEPETDPIPGNAPRPNMKTYSGDKSTYTDAITLGQAYIAANT